MEIIIEKKPAKEFNKPNAMERFAKETNSG
jgi:hypothetical protein